jgi:sulfur-oxidizing protein SoxY
MRRRGILRGAVSLALLPWPALAGDAALDAAMREAVGDAVPVEGGMELRVPAVAENGAQVPLTVLVDSAMTAEDHVTAIHVFATRNPTPGVASFHLFPGLARAEVQTRIRIAEEQQVVALARMADGTVRRAAAGLRVTRGGCLS